MQYVILDAMYWTLVQCATGEILPFRIYGFYPVYPIGNTPNSDMIIKRIFGADVGDAKSS
jgi:hypothetical protein